MFAQKGQFAADIKDFLRGIASFKQRIRSSILRRRKAEKELAAKLELKLEDASLHLGLPPTHQMTIAAVAYSIAQEIERKKHADEDDETANYPSVFGGHEW
jgi:hypothetical protein